MKIVLTIAMLAALTGCASMECPTKDQACLAALENRQAMALMMFGQSMQQQAQRPVYQIPVPASTYTPAKNVRVCDNRGQCSTVHIPAQYY